jgi:hypothetical protein
MRCTTDSVAHFFQNHIIALPSTNEGSKEGSWSSNSSPFLSNIKSNCLLIIIGLLWLVRTFAMSDKKEVKEDKKEEVKGLDDGAADEILKLYVLTAH